ncbi:MAG: RNA pseudouridine synthase [Chlamydiia bacterium]|nr:RNA pseudouridine synthase [Chlamydiia bacterium]
MKCSVNVLYEDNHLLIVDKPAGLLTQPSGTSQPSLETKVKTFLKERDNKPGGVYLHAIHRLDKEVSGIVVFAKTQKALQRMQEALRNNACTKVYRAQVDSFPHEEEATLTHFLLKKSHRTSVVHPDTPGAKSATLQYKLVDNALEITLITGRYHQIRAQLAAIDCPIIGDSKYGSTTPYQPYAIALHHHRFVFPHPITKKLITIISEVE